MAIAAAAFIAGGAIVHFGEANETAPEAEFSGPLVRLTCDKSSLTMNFRGARYSMDGYRPWDIGAALQVFASICEIPSDHHPGRDA